MSAEMLLKARNITRKFPGVVALKDFDFDLHIGEIHGLVGENGAGKSTFIKILSGILAPDEGVVEIKQTAITLFTPKAMKELGVATVFQELSLIQQLSIEENLYLGKEESVFGFIRQKQRKKAAQWHLTTLGMNHPPGTRVSGLRAGEKRLIEFLKAVIKEPIILILDEPTEALSGNETQVLFSVMRGLKNKGVGIIYISHKLSEVFEVCDRVTVLRDGVSRGTHGVSDLNPQQLIKLMVGREINDLFPERRARSSRRRDVLLEIRDLNVDGILKNVSLRLHEGEILGISGLVGAGRTELIKAIVGLLPITSGTIFVQGKEVRKTSPAVAKHLGFGLIPEDRYQDGIIPYLSVKDNIILPSIDKKEYSGVIFRKEKAIRTRTEQLISSLKIKVPDMHVHLMQLSGGNQQKVVVAKSICLESKLFIFDEPTQGIDVGTKLEIYQLIKDIADKNAGVMMISSDLKEILGLSDRILVMRKGRIVGEYTGGEATEERILSDALHS